MGVNMETETGADVRETKNKFENAMLSMVDKKKRTDDDAAHMSTMEYERKLLAAKSARSERKNAWHRKSAPRREYDVITIDGKEKLIKYLNDGTFLYYLKADELFDVFHFVHMMAGHHGGGGGGDGRDRMWAEVRQKYCNVTKESVAVFLHFCPHCRRQNDRKPGKAPELRVQKTCRSRAQIDLIDMQSQSYNGFRYILKYRDPVTKCVLLRPLRTKRTDEIEHNLLDVYAALGTPTVLRRGGRRPFLSSIVKNVYGMWGYAKFVHGKPIHRKKLGSLNRANRDIEAILTAWMADNESKDWPTALKFIEFQKNRAFNSDTVGSPRSEAVHDCPEPIELPSTNSLYDELSKLQTDEHDAEICIETLDENIEKHDYTERNANEDKENKSNAFCT